jgi:hypothetical protein
MFAQFTFENFNSCSKDVKDEKNAKSALFDCTEVSKKYEIKARGFHVTKPITNYFITEIPNNIDNS